MSESKAGLEMREINDYYGLNSIENVKEKPKANTTKFLLLLFGSLELPAKVVWKSMQYENM